jgi:hypothetical protein
MNVTHILVYLPPTDTYVFDNHHKKGKFDAECFLGIRRARNVVGAHVCAHDLKHAALDVHVRDALDVSISNLFVPDLQRLAPV